MLDGGHRPREHYLESLVATSQPDAHRTNPFILRCRTSLSATTDHRTAAALVSIERRWKKGVTIWWTKVKIHDCDPSDNS